MTLREFRGLLAIIDAKIATYAARDSSDGGLIESVRESELIKEFEERMHFLDRAQ